MSPAGIALSRAAQELLRAVLDLRPRIATFDCDGTLWPGDSGEQFFRWELQRGLIPHPIADWIQQRYRDYKDGRVSEEDICGEMVTIHDGLNEAELYAAGEEFFREKFLDTIFPDMRELVRRLNEAGCQIWAVSSTNEWVVRAGARELGIPDDHVLAACVHCQNGVATGRLRSVPTDEDKAVAIRASSIGRGGVPSTTIVDAAFGNSIHDLAMLELAAHPFAINANPDLQQIAQRRGWPVYFPLGTAAHHPAP